LLINGSNNAWYGNSLAPHQHLQIARMRALETGRELIRATTTGISALVDQHGQLIARSPQFKTHVLEGEVQPRTGATPYVRVGNWPVNILVFLLLMVLVVLSRRQRAG
jgi:apolipoprotein N-acyltransferase